MSGLRLAARWVLPVDGPPIAEGAVLVDEDGRLAAVGPDDRVPRPPLAVGRHLGDVALLPGLVNTHAHLELTALRGLVRQRPFLAWIQAVRRIRESLAPAHLEAAARWGVLESYAAGITTTGDTGSSGAPARALAAFGSRGVAYQEVFGPDPAQRDASLAGLVTALAALTPLASERLRIGVSPHAPYTVSAALLAAVAELAAARKLPLAMHLAESPEEHAFVHDGAGPFAEAHARRGIAVTPRAVTPVAWALAGGLAALRPLLIHCVTADGDDAARLRAADAAVAHCPWSNAVLGHGRADLATLRRSGVRVGLGTDSVAAGGGLDLFAEARHAAAVAGGLNAREMIGLITREGARALDIADAGMLVPGAWADLVAVRLSRAAFAGPRQIEEALAWSATAADVSGTWVAGRLVYTHGRWPGVDLAAERMAFEAAAAAAAAAAS